MSHSCLATILWVVPVCTAWPLPPLQPCRSPGPGQGWVCDDLVAPPDSRIVAPLILTLVSQRLLDVQKFDSDCFHLSSHRHWWWWCLLFVLAETKNRSQAPYIPRILPGHTSHDPCLLSTLISLPPLRHEGCFHLVSFALESARL